MPLIIEGSGPSYDKYGDYLDPSDLFMIVDHEENGNVILTIMKRTDPAAIPRFDGVELAQFVMDSPAACELKAGL